MKATRIVTGIVLLTTVSACGFNPFKRIKTETTEIHFTSPKMPTITTSSDWLTIGKAECKTKDDTSLIKDQPEQHKTITVARNSQNVLRRDCQGNKISEKIEVVQSPSAEVILTPVGQFEVNDFTIDLVNRTTCDSDTGGAALKHLLLDAIVKTATASPATQVKDTANNWLTNLFGESKKTPSYQFSANTSPTFFDLDVDKDRDNFIDYEFFGCDSLKDGECLNKKSLEKGTLVLKVEYSEATLPGTLERVDCDKDKDGKDKTGEPVTTEPANN